ncbi:nucleoplasmin-like, partial [Eublepharis macularius]|uniref:Nucleoplasmin-like n=1 Tax=Eublepharis macularius TaxID=481883 RepID=A0AA97KFM2_EUBMA
LLGRNSPVIEREYQTEIDCPSLQGCELNSGTRRCVVKVEDNLLEHIVFLKSVSLGEEAEDELHVVAVESKNMTSVYKPVPIASLRLSVLPMVSLGNFEFTPPVAFVLKSGTGPVYLVGQHLILEGNSDYESPGYDTQTDDTQSDDTQTDDTQAAVETQVDDTQTNGEDTQKNVDYSGSNAGTEDYPGGTPEASGPLILKRPPLRI